MKKLLLAAATVFLATTIWAKPAATISGTYLEVRSCDVYTGPCFSNAEMGSNGKEAILTWSIKEGAWQGVDLAGLERHCCGPYQGHARRHQVRPTAR